MSFRRTLPLASVAGRPSADDTSTQRSWPAPSAHTMTACARSASRRSRLRRNPPSPSSLTGTSGIRTKLASVDASAAWHAMKPECRPISLTRPIPLRAPVASTCALRIASTAAANALSNPKLRSMKWMSLSIVLGIPITAIERPRRWTSATIWWRPAASRRRRSRTGRQFRSAARVSTISPGSWLPRDVPRMVPPCSWISAHPGRTEAYRLVAVSRHQPLEPVSKTEDVLHAVRWVSSRTSPRITLLMPGQRPPQVTIPQRSCAGSKKIRSRGPAASKAGSWAGSAP